MVFNYNQFLRNVWLLYFLVRYIHSQKDNLFVQNLDERCLKCLCYATSNCNLTYGCQAGYCGPYRISRVYWIDAGRVVMNEDVSERNGAYEDCSLNYHCAQRIVKNYLARFGKDCNGDGVTNCDDYSMVNANGGYGCTANLSRSENGRKWINRYNRCAPLL